MPYCIAISEPLPRPIPVARPTSKRTLLLARHSGFDVPRLRDARMPRSEARCARVASPSMARRPDRCAAQRRSTPGRFPRVSETATHRSCPLAVAERGPFFREVAARPAAGGVPASTIEPARLEEVLRLIDRNRKRDAGIAFDSRAHHTDCVAALIDNRTAAVPGFDDAVDLQRAAHAGVIPAQRRDAALRRADLGTMSGAETRPTSSARPNGKPRRHSLSVAKGVGVSEGHIREIRRADEQHREIEYWIGGVHRGVQTSRYATASRRGALGKHTSIFATLRVMRAFRSPS